MLDIHTYLKEQADKGNETPYTVQFLLEKPQSVDKALLLTALNDRCGQVEPVQEGEGELLAFAHMNYATRFQEGLMPVQCLFSQAEEVVNPEQYMGASITQTWDWAE